MNNAFVLSREVELVAGALDALRDATGIRGEILDYPDAGADTTVLLTINGRKLR